MELLTGRKFTSGNAVTEIQSVKREDVLGNKVSTILLSNFPVQSITEFKCIASDGTASSTFGTLTSAQIAAGTYYTADYWLDVMEEPLNRSVVPTGRITMITYTFSEGTNNAKISYTYGYTSVPTVIRDLATCLAGIRAWLRFLGGSYNRINSYSIPQQNVNKGDFYARGMQNIQMLRDEADRLLDRIGRKPRTLFFSSGGSR